MLKENFNSQIVYQYWKEYCINNKLKLRSNSNGLNFNLLYLHLLYDESNICTDYNFHIGVCYPNVDVNILPSSSNSIIRERVIAYSDVVQHDSTMLYVLEYFMLYYPDAIWLSIEDLLSLKKSLNVLRCYSDDNSIRGAILQHCMRAGQFMNDIGDW